MPPKAPSAPGRGGRSGGRRPRGGGAAGQATTTRETEASDTPMQDAEPVVVESTESSASSTATPSASASVGAAPTAQMTAPDTATPAATPAVATAPKAPTRTNSLRRTAASATPGPSTRGAKKAVIPAPRAVRRSKEERETLEKAEQKKRSDEARAALREQRRAGRGRGDFKSDRGRGGKARGGFMGDRERGIREQVASGPFSAGQVSAEGSYRSRAGGGGGGGGGYGGGGGGGGARIKSEGGTYGSIHSIKAEDGGYISSDEDAGEEGPRQDVDVIDISDDEDNGGKRGMVPIRVSRVAHKEREKPVSTEVKSKDAATVAGASSSTGRRTPSPTAVRKGKQRVKDVLVTGTQRRWKGAWSDSEDSEPEIQIKPEPTDDSTEITAHPMEIDDVQIKESSSPDTRRKSGKSRARLHGLPTEAPPQQTKEEQREWERHHMDLELIREELGQLAMPPPPKPKQPTTAEDGTAAADAEGDTNMTDSVDAADVRRQQQQGEGVEGEDQQPAIEDRRADRVYLFQFPPILPNLLVSSNPTSAAAKKEAPPSPELSRRTKPNFDGSNNTQSNPVNLDDIPDISTTTASSAAAPSASSTTNTKENPVKVEDGSTNANIPASAGQSTFHSNVPSGFVGKLRVHASGRTTLDWGGTAMQVGMGTDVQFLQDVIVSRFFEPEDERLEDIAGVGKQRVKKEENRDKEDEAKGPGGEVMGLGQVRGKFVVTPDWEEIVGQRI